MTSLRYGLLCLLSACFSFVAAQSLLDTALDRSTYLADLRPEAQEVLGELAGAPVYALELTIHDDLSSLSAVQALRYTNRSRDVLDELYLYLLPNLLGGELELASVSANQRELSWALERAGSLLRVSLDDALWPGDAVILDLSYTVSVPEESAAGVNYGRLARYENALGLAHIFPVMAVYTSGGWDLDTPPAVSDPLFAEMGFYLVEVTAPEQLVLVATGKMIGTEVEAGRQVATFAAGPVRDFFLAGLQDYLLLSRAVGDTVIHSYAPLQLAVRLTDSLDLAAEALRIFEQRFGPYPYAELDMVAIPVQAGGIEFPGIFSISNAYYRQDRRDFFETIIVHEVAHQWFFGLVGSDQISEPWLDEVLTQYVTMLYYLDRYGEVAFERVRERHRSSFARSGLSTRGFGAEAAAYGPQEYGPVIYDLGPLLMADLADLIGKDTLDEILSAYVRKYRWSRAGAAEFEEVARAVCDCNLEGFFRDNVYGP